jgi:hypothetical protein
MMKPKTVAESLAAVWPKVWKLRQPQAQPCMQIIYFLCRTVGKCAVISLLNWIFEAVFLMPLSEHHISNSR